MQTTKTHTVMIADDAPFMRNMLRSILELGGYSVVAEAADGVEAVARYRELRPALTLLDIVMPGKGGVDAASEIVSHDERAKVVLLCGSLERDEVAAGRMMSTWDVITKPYKAEEVLEVVRRVARR